LARVFQQRVVQIRDPVDTHHLDRDGSHALAKKGGEAVAYQGRKKAKPSKVLPLTAANGFILASTGSIAGHHHDAFDLKDNLRAACKFINGLGISIAGRYFNADAAFDTQAARWTCFYPKGIPTIAENKPARKKVKRGPKRWFDAAVYKVRFSRQRTFAWLDKFRAWLVRFDCCATHFMGAHFIVYTLINVRHRLATD